MTNSLLAVKWERFFVDVGIPDKISAEYAKKFMEQRVQFEMRGELTKNLLIELGIKALGDQMAILHFLKKEKDGNLNEMNISDSISAPLIASAKHENGQMVTKKGIKAPDRDDIYHIRMPSGSTPKTREILKKQNLLRSVGLMKRGMNGIRKSGEEIRPVEKSVVSRLGGTLTSSAEVSSTTHEVYERLGIRGLVSDSMPEPVIFSNTVSSAGGVRYRQRKKLGDPAALFKRSISDTAAFGGEGPVFRVRIPVVGESSRSDLRLKKRIQHKPVFTITKRGNVSKNMRENGIPRMQKRLSIQSRLSLASNRVILNKRKNAVSIFDRLG